MAYGTCKVLATEKPCCSQVLYEKHLFVNIENHWLYSKTSNYLSYFA